MSAVLQVQYGYINLEEIFRDSTRLSVVDLSSLLMAKIAATSVCVGGGLVGGLFAPSLFIGALVGDIMGHFVANRWVLRRRGRQLLAHAGHIMWSADHSMWCLLGFLLALSTMFESLCISWTERVAYLSSC